MMDRFESAALDRHITGNWGEDQFADGDDDDWDDIPDDECPHCRRPFAEHIEVVREDAAGDDFIDFDCPKVQP